MVFIRHGKSSWKYPVDDKIRPLKKRGISDITLIANQFLKLKIKPDLVVSSPAKRALDTCRILMKILEISKDILQIKSQLY
ncbi:histidine phosphatase family protein, partial [Flavobacteriaceae bacterium]|nr:histidine phosphatase family protein [Flavobacteriaceae bacterium]